MSQYGIPGTPEYQKAWRQANADKQREYTARWRERHPERFAAALAKTDAKRRADLPGAAARTRANRKGVTIEQYSDMLLRQEGKCAICGMTEAQNGRSFDIDHDHSCCPGEKACAKCVRGLLCGRCNRGIGMFGDDPYMLRRAMLYLTRGRDLATGWPV